VASRIEVYLLVLLLSTNMHSTTLLDHDGFIIMMYSTIIDMKLLRY